MSLIDNTKFNILSDKMSEIDISNPNYENIDKIFQLSVEVLEIENKQLSNADLTEQDLLHYLEFERLSACQISKVTKKLIEVRKERREIKRQIEACNNFKTFLKAIKNVDTKAYKPRMIKLEDILK